MSVRIILCTVPDKKTGKHIAAELVEKRIAACVNIAGPMVSRYLWDGAVQDDEEYQLIIKTSAARLEDAHALVCELHPYDVPEWLIIDNVSGSAEYVNWLQQTVTP